MDCIFCKIAAGQMPCKKIYEDDKVLAFLDINPANPGHALVIPKKHFETLFDIDDDTLKELITKTKAIATIIKDRLKANAVNILQNNGKQAGQLVNHIHFHIIPRFPNDKVLITYQRVNITEKELDDMQKKLTSSGSSGSGRSQDWQGF